MCIHIFYSSIKGIIYWFYGVVVDSFLLRLCCWSLLGMGRSRDPDKLQTDDGEYPQKCRLRHTSIARAIQFTNNTKFNNLLYVIIKIDHFIHEISNIIFYMFNTRSYRGNICMPKANICFIVNRHSPKGINSQGNIVYSQGNTIHK